VRASQRCLRAAVFLRAPARELRRKRAVAHARRPHAGAPLTAAVDTPWHRSLLAWLVRDALLLAGMWLALRALAGWHAASGSFASAAGVGIAGFVFAYAACYVVHEWGHDLGARALGARPPRGSTRGILLPLFDPRAHTRAQFLGLGFGGQLGYLAVAAGILAAFRPELAQRAAALGAIAFVVQSLTVDWGVLGPVLRGADVLEAARVGTAPERILRRTGVAWTALAALLVAWHTLGGGLP
jgi:hypothetical protein